MTLASLLVLALIDSINPSAIVVTLYLLSRAEAGAQVGVYVATIFVTYFAIGLLMILGIDTFMPSIGPLLDSRPGLAAQGLLGLALLVYALRGSPGGAAAAPVAPPSARTYAALALLGVTVTMMEIPTAVPYLAAVALITSAELPAAQWLPMLAGYNAIFVLPPVLLLAGHLLFGEKLRERYADLMQRLQHGARETALWIAGLVGGALLFTSAIELFVRWR